MKRVALLFIVVLLWGSSASAYSRHGVSFDKVDIASAKNLYKLIQSSKKCITYKNKRATQITTAFDYVYLAKTNYTCIKGVKNSQTIVLNKRSDIDAMINENNRIVKLEKAKIKYCNKIANGIIKKSGAKKAKTSKGALSCIDKYFLKNFKYDYDYANKNGDRAKMTKYQDSYGANMYYLFKKHKGICTDFAVAYKYICTKLGYQCFVEVGSSLTLNKRDHAWNVVKSGGMTYYKDITMDVTGGTLYWSQLCSIAKFLKTHHMMTYF